MHTASTSPRPILVLGATGTVGDPLVRALAAQGHPVRAATRNPDAYDGPGHAVPVDLADPTTWTRALDGVGRLFLLSPPGHADQFALLRPFVEAALAAGTLDRIVTMTAQGVDADDTIPFRKLERFIEAHEVPFVHLRPTWFAQNFHTFWGHGIREQGLLSLPAEDAAVAFIDARDIAASAAAALTREDIELDRAYVLTGPAALTHAAAAAVLGRATERSIAYRSIDDDAFRQQLAPSGLPADYIELLVGLFAVVRMGVASEVNDSVAQLTGHPPRPLETYAQDFRAALRP
ncbi:MAG: NmrA family NAD(P)-binding protein [Myxococcota bacterium]